MKLTPKFKSGTFQCPHCQTTAQQHWFDVRSAGKNANAIIQHLFYEYRPTISEYAQTAISKFLKEIGRDFGQTFEQLIPKGFSVATCSSCKQVTLWIEHDMVYPNQTSLPAPNEDMNDDIKGLYQEAATILTDSPKGAAALLRLALQKLLEQVGKSGKNINNDIKELVAEGLSPRIQKALDLVRVIGNNAVHPGEINLDDNSDIALKLFPILNFIADELITKPKELELLYNDTIPEETQEHIKQRDDR